MKSRGSIYAMSAGVRRGFVLLWTALLLSTMLLQYVVASPVIAASGLLAGTVAGFEVDGDLKSGNAAGNPGNIPAGLYTGLANAQDWLDGNSINGLVDPANPPESFIFRDAVDSASVPGDVSPDTSAYVGGNKETDTRDWGYFNNAGPNDKTDYRHVMAGVKVSGGNPYVFLGAERISTNGTMVVDFELNQKPFKVFSGAPGISKPDRSINDILISLEYANGGSNPEVTLYRVSAVQTFSTGQVVTFSQISDATTVNAVRSATNFQALANVPFPTATYNVEAFAWAESSVNIAALGLPVTCLTFGQGSIRSRTGGAPDASQLKDASEPFPLSVNTCAKIAIEKVDKDGAHLAGATFEIAPNPLLGAPANSTLTITDGDANDLDPRAGYILLGPCEPQVTYTVTEKTAPAGYIKDPASQSKTASAGETVTFTFTNGLGSISWVKNRTGGTLLGGATFTITPDPTDWTGILTVVDNGPNDADPVAGQFKVTGVRVDRNGGYEIAESVPPAGWIGSSATATVNPTTANPNVSVTAQTWVNSLGSIRWVKNGPDGSTPLGGATFTITPDPLDGEGSLTVVDNTGQAGYTGADADATPGKFQVDNARTGTYSVAETAAPTGYILDSSPASVTVSADTQHPQITADTFVNHLGKIRWLKYGPDGKTLLGGAVFSVSPDPATGTGTGSISVADCVAPGCSGPDKDETPGEFELQNVRVGSYTIIETSAPAGYVLDATPLKANITSPMALPYTANAGSVTNTLGSISWVKNGPNGTSLLGGATFTIDPNPQTGSGVLEVVDNTGQAGYSGADTDETAGEFKVVNVLVDSANGYVIAETAAPAGYIRDTDTVTVDPTTLTPVVSVEAGTWVNTLGELLWTKDKGDNAKTLLGGATFSVTPNPFTGSGLLTVVDNDASDQDKADGKFHLVDVRVGTYTVEETAAPEGYTKSTATCTIIVSATNPLGTPACSFSNPPIPPAIDIVKTAGNSEADQAADNTTLEVEALSLNVTYRYVVTNTGNVRLTGVTVMDDNGTPGNPADDFEATCENAGGIGIAQPFELAVGASVTCYAVLTVSQDTTNIAMAAGVSVGEGTPVSDSDDAVVEIVGPAITIVKTAGASAASQEADGATYVTEDFADNVTYKYVVTNTGTTALNTVGLTDDKLGAITCPKATLAVAESMTCTAKTRVSVDTINTGTAKAISPAGTAVQARDDAVVDVVTPAITVVKTAGNAADGTTLYTNGGNVTYAYLVTNTGDVNLTNVSLADNKLGAITCPKAALAIGESMTCTKTAAVNVDTTNIATVKGDTPHATVSDFDDAVVLVRRVAIDKTNDTEGKVAPGATVGYKLTFKVVNGPIPSMTVKDVLPANFGTPSAISDGGAYDAATRTITWTLANVANGKMLTYNVVIATATQGGLYTNTATITNGPCVAGDCDDDSVVPVWRVAITKVNNATASLIKGAAVVYTLSFAVQNGPIDSMVVTDTLPAQVVNPRNFSVAPASVVGQVITWNLSDVANGSTINYTATIADASLPGSYTNVAEITEGPCVGGQCDDDSTVTVVAPAIRVVKTAGTAADGAELLLAVPGNVVFTYLVTNTGTAALQGVVLVDDKATPGTTADDVTVTCPKTTLAAGESMTCTLTLPVGIGLRTNIATVTAHPVIAPTRTVSDTDDAVVRVPQPQVTPTPTPKLTLPPTSTLQGDAPGTDGNGLFLILLALAGLMLTAGYLIPAPARARRRTDRG